MESGRQPEGGGEVIPGDAAKVVSQGPWWAG